MAYHERKGDEQSDLFDLKNGCGLCGSQSRHTEKIDEEDHHETRGARRTDNREKVDRFAHRNEESRSHESGLCRKTGGAENSGKDHHESEICGRCETSEPPKSFHFNL